MPMELREDLSIWVRRSLWTTDKQSDAYHKICKFLSSGKDDGRFSFCMLRLNNPADMAYAV
jgi:hypothetical protein